MTKSMIPLATGMLLPLSTFLNVQALSIPGWTASLSSLNHCLRHSPIDDKLPLPDPVVFYPNEIIAILLSLSFSSGILANLALFNRLLFERKIKTMQRVVFYGSISQGLFCLVANLLFIEEWLQMPRERTVTGGPMYSFATALVSFLVAVLLLIQQRRNLAQEHYDYTLLDLSNAQRQSVLLTMLTISYTLGMALVFSYIEGWEYDDALYWSVTTLTTIGFGDIAPKSISGRVCLPPMAFVGIGVVGANIWSVRQMILELLTHRLASEYSKSLGITRDDASLPDRHDWTKRFSLDSAAFPSQVGHCDTAPTVMDRPRSHHSLDDSVLPDHIVDFAEHSLSLPKTLKRQSSSSQRSLSRSRSFASVMPDEPAPRKALVISRGKHLPRLTIVGGSDLKRRQIADTTMQTFRAEIWTSVLLEVANVCIFGSVFAYLENWALMDGIYFATTALLTIGKEFSRI